MKVYSNPVCNECVNVCIGCVQVCVECVCMYGYGTMCVCVCVCIYMDMCHVLRVHGCIVCMGVYVVCLGL